MKWAVLLSLLTTISIPIVTVELKTPRLSKYFLGGVTTVLIFYVFLNIMIFHAVETTAKEVASELTNFENLTFASKEEVAFLAMKASRSHYIYDWIDPFAVLVLNVSIFVVWLSARAFRNEISKSTKDKRQNKP